MIAIILLTLILAFFISMLVGGWLFSAPVYKGPVSDHFDGKQFINYGGIRAKGMKELFKWLTSGEKRPKWQYIEGNMISQTVDGFDEQGTARIYYVNHSSFLIQVNGLNILTDPVWSEYASPFQWIGPKRMRPPGISLDALPQIDLILLSHNHYDHLDLPTLKILHKKHQPQIVCPLGVDLFLRKKGFNSLNTLDWWETISWSGLQITSAPSQHFSARGMFDRDRTLWCGFVIQAEKLKIYYVGDTGYGDIFQEIGERLGPFDLSIIPIGAYHPRWFMSPIHCDPAQAIQIHHDIRSNQSIACHYGTFPLAMDGQNGPIDELMALPEYLEVNKQFIILPEGESMVVQGGKQGV